jgi:MarR family transcriptional regulator, lower aerobic nicotinate degradation pathway regulator
MARESQSGEGGPERMRELPSWLISRAAGRSQRLLSEAFAGAGVRGYHYRILVALDELGPLSQVGISDRTQIDRSDVVAALNELTARGLVERSRDPGDRRRNLVTIKPAGRKEVRTLDAVVDGVQDELLAPLSAADRAELIRILGQLVDANR